MTESIALPVLVKATLVLMLALLLMQLMRSARASRRFVILAWSFALLAALPLAAVFAPTVPVVVRESRQLITTGSSAPVSVPAALLRPATAAAQPAYSRTAPGSGGMVTFVAVVWAAGVAITLIPVLATMRRLRMLRRTARAFGIHDARGAHVRVLVHDALRAPVTFGWVRPVVLLPGDV